MELEEEPSLREKIFKFAVFIFISLLTIMLIFTFIQGDSEKYLLQVLTGQDKSIAGKIAGEAIPNDYFKAARLECYYLFKQRFPTLADDISSINNCAYNQIKSQKIDSVLAKAVGFRVSEIAIKQDIAEEARRIHSDSKVSAGYSKEEMRSLEDIYKAILNQVPMNFRQDFEISRKISEGFLYSDIKETEEEKKIKGELETVKLSISYISFTDDDLLKQIGGEFPVTEEEIKKEYDESVKNKTIPIGSDGKVETLENRKAFILNKLRSEKKEKKTSELKAKILTIKGEANSNLSNIASITNTKVQDLKDIPFSKFESKENKDLPKFLTTSAFLKEATKANFGKGRITGPFTDKNQTIYVDFKELKFDSTIGNKLSSNQDLNPNRVRMFIYEIKQSLSGNYPIERNIVDKNSVE